MSNFLKALRKESVDATPVWFKRQAGCYQEEYRKTREKYAVLEIAKNPELIAEITLMTSKKTDIDAFILFTDIILPMGPMGVKFNISPGTGPVVKNILGTRNELENLHPLKPEEDFPFVLEGIKIVKFSTKLPLIRFSGAPFTLFSYMLEGGPSRNFLKLNKFMHEDKETFHAAMRFLTDSIINYLNAQINVGADVVQVFDSWVLSPADYHEFVLPYIKRLMNNVHGIPIIHFWVNTFEILHLMAEADRDAVGVDWRTEIDRAWWISPDRAIQGNLAPSILLSRWDEGRRTAKSVLSRVNRPEHIFNLGHGILPQTNPGILSRLVDYVHEETSK